MEDEIGREWVSKTRERKIAWKFGRCESQNLHVSE